MPGDAVLGMGTAAESPGEAGLLRGTNPLELPINGTCSVLVPSPCAEPLLRPLKMSARPPVLATVRIRTKTSTQVVVGGRSGVEATLPERMPLLAKRALQRQRSRGPTPPAEHGAASTASTPYPPISIPDSSNST
jgi:hypothetical protein